MLFVDPPRPHAALTVPEAAESLRISESHCRRLIRAGRLPSVKLGRRTLVPAAALTELLNAA